MVKCLENVSLNKVTLKQYQELYTDMDKPFSDLPDNYSNVRLED
jgi:hypothetical protein